MVGTNRGTGSGREIEKPLMCYEVLGLLRTAKKGLVGHLLDHYVLNAMHIMSLFHPSVYRLPPFPVFHLLKLY